MFTVVGNLARAECRRSAQGLRLVRRLATVADHADEVADRLDGEARARRLAKAVHRLPPALREVVELCLLGRLSHAEVLGIVEVSVRSRASRPDVPDDRAIPADHRTTGWTCGPPTTSCSTKVRF
ncbi:hypothetical protein GCM10029964_121890 [Kibdelosporangium lantanae]